MMLLANDPLTTRPKLARGFTAEQMAEFVRIGLANATAERVVAGGKTMEVATVRITAAGRRVSSSS